MNERTLELFELLAKALIAAAAGLLALTVLGTLVIATTETALPVVDEFTRQNRGTFAIGALGAGITAAGVLSGLGAILQLFLAGWREDHPAPPSPQEPAKSPRSD